jgi:hypothetical protein
MANVIINKLNNVFETLLEILPEAHLPHERTIDIVKSKPFHF